MKQVVQQTRAAAKLTVSLCLLLCVLSASLLPAALQLKQLSSEHLSLLEVPFDEDSVDQGDETLALLSAQLPRLATADTDSAEHYLFPDLSTETYSQQLARAPPYSSWHFPIVRF